ncbi:MAG: Mur ligase domain-containing protein [Bacteroidales bacterium]|nr:Mur ligase domain-containing protein [Bacteroidales bacterium]
MRVHFIAVGGAVMHNLAIALHKKGYKVTGSDDEIFDPALSRLQSHGLLPDDQGWYLDRITPDTDRVILGMHARKDNPELLRARELGVPVLSFPEYLYEQTRDKRRIVIAGSHGKTTITAMVMHVLKYCGLEFDYMAGSQVEGFDDMVHLSDKSKIAVFEGDEYLTSPLDPRPKFHLYRPHIAVINGIAWDHINVFPDPEIYREQFAIFAGMIEKGGELIWYSNDPETAGIAGKANSDVISKPYGIHGYFINRKGFFAATENRVVPLKIFGEHNMQNLSAAKAVCLSAGVNEDQFYDAIKGFRGAARRLQLIEESEDSALYLDFAHAPSKVKATVEAVAERYPRHRIVAILELHTYSSLNSRFISEYCNTLQQADRSIIYINRHAAALKKMEIPSMEVIKKAFGDDTIRVITDRNELEKEIPGLKSPSTVFLMMSSGDFDGMDIRTFAGKVIS